MNRVFGGLAILLRAALCLGFLGLFIAADAECKKAQKDDLPHGANLLIEYSEKKTDRLFGTVYYPNETLAADTVVEVYRLLSKQDPVNIGQQNRIAACVTGKDGQFSFDELPPGQYLLLVGTRKEAGINEIRVPVVLKPATRKHKSRAIMISLVNGT